MNIKKISKQTGISVDIIRYHERVGLLPQVVHNKSEVRDFSERGITTLEFVRCFRKADTSVESLVEYTALVEEDDGTREVCMTLLEEQRGKSTERTAELRSVYDRFNHKTENYQNIILKKEQALLEDDESE